MAWDAGAIATDDAPWRAPAALLAVWRTFDAFPMETLTKAWVFEHLGPRQRSVEELEAHRSRFGASGNCFDLALWLRARLQGAGITADLIGEAVGTEDAHVAVMATLGDTPYLCDLGDMWLEPIAIASTSESALPGFFPAAAVELGIEGARLIVTYHRPGGKISAQGYDLTPVRGETLREAAELNQGALLQRLVEWRDLARGAHWEYEEGQSRWSTDDGLIEEPPAKSDAEWAQRIGARTGMDVGYVGACLELFRELTVK